MPGSEIVSFWVHLFSGSASRGLLRASDTLNVGSGNFEAARLPFTIERASDRNELQSSGNPGRELDHVI